ncbi:uncharacterized protein V1516DRAFT_682401 [Lipomyces oligophaga]|uniref:uncharacterized protein n=1 Tax=Lipomyces oligophaga TaxID=45792 RepID=UPI0034CDC72D
MAVDGVQEVGMMSESLVEPTQPGAAAECEHNRDQFTHSRSPSTMSLAPSTQSTRASIVSRRRRWKLGLILLFLVVLLWVSSSFMVNAIFETEIYRKPYLVTYICTASFSLYLIRPLLAGSLTWSDIFTKKPKQVDFESESESASFVETQFKSEALSIHETSMLSLQFCVLWFIANWLANACLSYTTVASGTILACTSSFFTLIIGSLFRVERFSGRKLVAVAASLTGIILISTQDSAADNDENPLSAGSIIVGDLMSLSSAAVYGLYTTLLKMRIGDESRINMQIFFGCVGVWNSIILWPLLFILHFTGGERFELPPSGFVWIIVLGNAAVTFASDYLWIVTILMTSPLVVTMGLSGTIPIAVTGDVLFNNVSVTVWYLLGAFLVASAFFVINRDEEKEYVNHQEEEPEHPIAL